MRATTIKLDGKLLDDLDEVRPASQSLTGYVRQLLLDEIRRHRMRAAGDKYAKFLKEHKDEREWLSEWAEAPLETPARPGKKR